MTTLEKLEIAKKDLNHHEQAAEAARQEITRLTELCCQCDVLSLLSTLDSTGILGKDKKVTLIKAVRMATGLGLKEAKAIVDELFLQQR